MSPEEEAQLYTTDTYTFDEADKSFFVAGKSFTAKQLADALHALPEEKRKAVLLYYPGWYRDLRAFGSVFSVPAPQVFLREDVYAFTYAGKGLVCRI